MRRGGGARLFFPPFFFALVRFLVGLTSSSTCLFAFSFLCPPPAAFSRSLSCF